MYHPARLHLLFLCVTLTCTGYSLVSQAEQIDIYIRDDVYADYKKFVNKQDVLAIKSFRGKSVRRDVVDMVLAQQALSLGGFHHTFHYISGKVNFRNTKMLQSGELLISFDSYWLADAQAIKNAIYISAPLIRKGEYIAGIYTNVKNSSRILIKSMDDFSQLTSVSTPKWRSDWSTLQSLNLKELIHENEWLSMARMVHLGWVDFMLMPFNSTPDQSFTLGKIHLVPLPGIAVQLNDSRHYVISRKHKYGRVAYNALQKGLIQLRGSGTIERAYREAGFFISDKYTIINAKR